MRAMRTHSMMSVPIPTISMRVSAIRGRKVVSVHFSKAPRLNEGDRGSRPRTDHLLRSHELVELLATQQTQVDTRLFERLVLGERLLGHLRRVVVADAR